MSMHTVALTIHDAEQQNHSQLLDLLLHKNDSPNLPADLRYDIRSPPPDADSVPGLEPDRSPEHRHSVKAEDDPTLKTSSDATDPSEATKSLASLTKSLPHTTLAIASTENLLPSDIDSDEPTGYYSPSHEASHLAALDHSLGIASSSEPPKPPQLGPKIADKEKERQKQHELNNPVSAYNWLRKNQPQVFLQDNEGAEKSVAQNTANKSAVPKASPKPKGSRRSVVKKEKEEAEVVYDEEGFIIGGPGFDDVPPLGTGGRGKRKRQGDEAYRPKGGSSRPSKRKKRASGEKDRASGTPGTNGEGA